VITCDCSFYALPPPENTFGTINLGNSFPVYPTHPFAYGAGSYPEFGGGYPPLVTAPFPHDTMAGLYPPGFVPLQGFDPVQGHHHQPTVTPQLMMPPPQPSSSSSGGYHLPPATEVVPPLWSPLPFGVQQDFDFDAAAAATALGADVSPPPAPATPPPKVTQRCESLQEQDPASVKKKFPQPSPMQLLTHFDDERGQGSAATTPASKDLASEVGDELDNGGDGAEEG